MNLASVRDEIKATAQACDGTPTAKFVAVLVAAGVTDTKEIAAILGIGDRAVRKVRAELQDRNSSSAGTTGPEPQGRTGTPGPENGTTVPQTEPQDRSWSSAEPRAPARIETPSGLLSHEEKILKPPLPPRGPTPTDALKAFEAYNATALRCGLPQAAKLTPDRQRKIIARLRDYGLAGWDQALANIERSSFLTGTNDRAWRANLEFLLQASSFAKVHDGGYGNGRHAGGQDPAPKASPMRALLERNKAREVHA